jgi:hypothetical protein
MVAQLVVLKLDEGRYSIATADVLYRIPAPRYMTVEKQWTCIRTHLERAGVVVEGTTFSLKDEEWLLETVSRYAPPSLPSRWNKFKAFLSQKLNFRAASQKRAHYDARVPC